MSQETGQAPKQLGPFTLERQLGEGGMAVTWLAREQLEEIGGQRLVALKQILPHFVGDRAFREMFLDEARLSSLLTHQNICRVYRAGEIEGSLYICMEYIDGGDLWRLMHRARALPGGFPAAHALYITEQMLYGLHAAHTARGPDGEPLGLVHRDVSPQNVLVSRRGEVKVIDFGVAKARTNSSRTATGVVKGKVLYYSPEQLEAKPLDGRSDLFAVGLVLYEMLTGRHPLAGDTDVQTIHNYYKMELEPPSVYQPECAGLIDELVLRALGRTPGERFASADEMAQEVAEARFEIYPSYKPALLRDFVRWGLEGGEGEGYQMPQSRGGASGRRASSGPRSTSPEAFARTAAGPEPAREVGSGPVSRLVPPPSPFAGGAASAPGPGLASPPVARARVERETHPLWYVLIGLMALMAAGCLGLFGLAFLGALAQ